jgi:hypothetical protein
MLGVQRLLLSHDPFEGWITEKIEEALGQARVELTQKGLLEPSDDGLVRMDESLAIAVGTLGVPTRSLLINRITSDQTECKGYAHLAGGGWVWIVSEGEEQYRIELFLGSDELAVVIKTFLQLDEYPESSGEAFELTGEAIKQARLLAGEDGRDACANYLEEIVLAKGKANRFADALALPVNNGSIVELAWKGTWSRQVGTLAFIVEPEGLWLLELDEHLHELVKIELIGSDGLVTRVNAMIGDVDRPD